jgi:hypothetical protein
VNKCFWPSNEPRIHAVITNIKPPEHGEKLAEMYLSFNNRHDFEGEMILRVVPDEIRYHRIGDVYAAHFKIDRRADKAQGCFWPDHEPRIHAKITEIGPLGKLSDRVEMRWLVKQSEIECELVFRIPEKEAKNYRVGENYYAHFKLVSEH